MPYLSAAAREQASVPQPRVHWWCPDCPAEGWSQNERAAYLAGTRHWTDTHGRHRPERQDGASVL